MVQHQSDSNGKKYLLVTVDVEEDNWGFIRSKTTYENIKSIHLVQDIFDKYGIRPIYLCTYPVINDKSSYEIINTLFLDNKCDIGAHLHPWNTPPFDEKNNEYNSFLNNLSQSLIKSKLNTITSRIHEIFDTNPIIFRSGRWGFGDNVAGALVEHGYKVDVSVTPFMSWEKYGGGPSYIDHPYLPYFIRLKDSPITQNALLEIPVSIGFNRSNYYLWNKIHTAVCKIGYSQIRLSGLLNKTNILKKIWLSPEIDNLQDMNILIAKLIQKGCNLLHFSFHSTSLKPGCSPFVKTDQDLKELLNRIDLFFSNLVSSYEIVSIGSSDAKSLFNTTHNISIRNV